MLNDGFFTTETQASIDGRFYSLECLGSKVRSAFPQLELTWGDFRTIVDSIPNVCLAADDPRVKTYLASNYQIEIAPGKYGPDNFLRLSQLVEYPELTPITQGEPLAKRLALLSAAPSSILVPELDAQEFLKELGSFCVARYRKILIDAYGPNSPLVEESLDLFREVYPGVAGDALQNCPSREGSLTTISLDEVIISTADINPTLSFITGKAYGSFDVQVGGLQGRAQGSFVEEYKGDGLTRRRPSGDFFTVEMIAPPAKDHSTPQIYPLEARNGEIITSIRLQMSPGSLVLNASKRVNTVQTMTRWVEEHWGDEMDQITFSGKTFAFINTSSKEGLTVLNRTGTDAFKELQHLVKIYKLNGCAFQADEPDAGTELREFFNYADPAQPLQVRTHPRVGFVKYRLYIRLRCDFVNLVGFFESFDVTEDVSGPFNLGYNVSFRAEHTQWL